ncbi:MTA r1 domain-containing protein [Phthorimaea operculella]|nr:MTA r1 domain-containing protein [Phthorimaea operculella]
MKTRAAFFLRATPFTRLARKLCRALRRPRHYARCPFSPVNLHQVKHECSIAMAGLGGAELRAAGAPGGGTARARGPVGAVAVRLAATLGTSVPNTRSHEWLALTPKERMPQPPHVAFPKPPKAADGSLMYERVQSRAEIEAARLAAANPPPANALKRRAYDDINGLDRGPGPVRDASAAPPPAKRPNKHPAPMQRPSREQYAAMCARAQATGQPLPAHVFTHVNGKPNFSGRGGRRHVISWMDAPDDLYFKATEAAKAARRTFSSSELRRGARAPSRARTTRRTPTPWRRCWAEPHATQPSEIAPNE